ncbi:MAG: VOC family protein [candidate division KSB1 bacterium]|nr:VOC family protein [candidate division KSB1 bacterium]
MKFCWATINVKEMNESISFYQDILGLKLIRRGQATEDIELAFLGSGETQIELICNKSETKIEFGNHIFLGFEVDSLQETMKFLVMKEISIQSGPFRPNNLITFLYISDPNGLKIQLVENLKTET